MESERRTEGLMRRRKERRELDHVAFAVGHVTVVRSNHLGLQIQGGCLKSTGKSRMWIQRSWIHTSSGVHVKGDFGGLILKRKFALQLGFTDSTKSQSDSIAT
jgi:hypothetical protein